MVSSGVAVSWSLSVSLPFRTRIYDSSILTFRPHEIGYGIKKLQINLVIEDEKISLDELQQEIEGDEDHVQSTDIVRLTFIILRNVADANICTLFCSIGCYAETLELFFLRMREIAS